MQSQELHVRQVAGRYGRGPLRSGNIVATVTEVARVYRVRIDDSANPDAWMELTIEVETPDAMPRRGQQAS